MYYGWVLLVTLGFIYMTSVGAVFYGLGVMMPAMIEELNWSRAEGSTGFAVLSLTIGFAGPLVTLLMNRISGRMIIFLGGIILAAGTGLFYYVHSLPMYYLASVVVGIGVTMQSVLPGTQLVMRWFDRRRSLVLGLFMAFGGLGGVVGAPTLSYLLVLFENDWRVVWLFVGLVGLVGSVLSILLVRDRPEDVGQVVDGIRVTASAAKTAEKSVSWVYKTNHDWKLKEALGNYAYWITLVSGGVAVTGYMTVNSQMILHVMDMGLSVFIASTALGIQGAFSTAGRFISGLLGDYRVEPRTLFAAGLMAEGVGMVLLNYSSTPIVLYLAVIIFGLGFGLGLVASTTMMANLFGPKNTPSLLSFRIMTSTVLGSVGVVGAGYMADVNGNYQLAFYIYGVVVFIGGLLVLAVKLPKQKGSSVTT